MNISSRLQAIAHLVAYKTLADVGTDHAILPIYLAQQGKILFAVASDLNKGPLTRAQQAIALHKLSNMVQTRLGSGLSPVLQGECETLVVAGMGGMRIIDILKNDFELAKTFSQLIFQPQHNIPELRHFLVNYGFCIVDEEMVKEDGKFYFVLNCIYKQSDSYSPMEYALGKLENHRNVTVLKEYVDNQLKKTQCLLNHLEKVPQQLLLQNMYCSEAKAWLQNQS